MALHAPSERVVVGRIGAWEVRWHDEAGVHHGYFATHGMLHLQLWHAEARVSVLTPSALTSERFEIWRDGVRVAVRTWSEVSAHLSDLVSPTGEIVLLPGGAEVAALHTWLVIRDAVAALRRDGATEVPTRRTAMPSQRDDEVSVTAGDANPAAPALSPVRS